jgi:hypothetical protein
MKRRVCGIGALLTVAALAILIASGMLSAAPNGRKSSVQWDAKASQELAHALHYMHEVWNAGDLEAVKRVIAGDDVLVTFELGPDNKTPVALRSRDEIISFISNVSSDTGSKDEAFEMEMPKMNCRATGTFGVCTEECTVHLKKSGRDQRVDKLFGTAIAVKYSDGWKWIQWHMSVGKPAAIPASTALHELRGAVVEVDEYQTPGIESELSGIYPHPTDDNLYYVLANLKPPYRYGQKPMLAPEYRGKLLTVNRQGQVVKAVKIADDDFGGLTFVDGVAYLATTNSAEILKANPETGEILARYPLPSPAGGLDYDRDRKALIAQLYVGHPHLAVIDVKTGAITETLWSDESAMGLIKVAGDWLCTWASGWDPGSFSELRLIDQKNGHVLNRMKLDKVHSSLAPARDRNGNPAFLSLVTVDSATGKTLIRRYSYNPKS